MAQISVVLFEILCALYFSHVAFGRMSEAMSSIQSMKDHSKTIKRWKKTGGKVLRLGYNLSYEFPYLSSDPGRSDDGQELYDKRQEAIHNNIAFGHVHIEYAYKANGVTWIGRRVGPYVGDDDLGVLYKLKVGEKVAVYVNPDDGSESYLRAGTDVEIDRNANRIFLESFKVMIYPLAFIFAAIATSMAEFPF